MSIKNFGHKELWAPVNPAQRFMLLASYLFRQDDRIAGMNVTQTHAGRRRSRRTSYLTGVISSERLEPAAVCLISRHSILFIPLSCPKHRLDPAVKIPNVQCSGLSLVHISRLKINAEVAESTVCRGLTNCAESRREKRLRSLLFNSDTSKPKPLGSWSQGQVLPHRDP